jgi:hypothetical protein
MIDKKYTVIGYDAYGQTVSEEISVPSKSWKQTVRVALVAILGHGLSYRIGLTKFRKISGIKIG